MCLLRHFGRCFAEPVPHHRPHLALWFLAGAAGLAHAQGGTASPSGDGLRDARVRELERRIELLERRIGAHPATPAPNAGGSSAEPPAPVDLEETRALERALTREQGMVLAPSAWEIEPSLQVQHSSSRGLRIVQTASGPQVATGQQQLTRTDFGIGLRIGLPRAIQLGLQVPYVTLQNREEASSQASSTVARQVAWGGPEFRLTRQFAAQKDRMPAVLGYVARRPAHGDFRLGAPSIGTGFAASSVGFTLVQRDDPLVFVAAMSYTHQHARTLEGQTVQPGRNLGLKLTTLLATSPESSLRWGLDLQHAKATVAQGLEVLGSRNLQAVMEFGVSRLVSSKTLLDVSLGIGLTAGAPDFRLNVSLPVSRP